MRTYRRFQEWLAIAAHFGTSTSRREVMTSFGSSIFAIATLLLTCWYPPSSYAMDPPTQNIGSFIPDLRFKDIRALTRNLSEIGKPKAWVLVFTTTQCPLVRQTLPKLVELHNKWNQSNIEFVAINVGVDDTLREMASQAIDFEVPFTFVKDIDHSCVRSLGVQRTPEVVILDAQMRLCYRGRVDDQLRLGGSRPQPTRRDLEEAIKDVLAGRPVSVAETPVDGCLISPIPMPDPNEPAPKYYGEVDAILFQHCGKCHRPENSAPFSLLTADDARANSQMIAEVVRDQTMPPWYASKNHGVFQNDASLSREERDTLLRWVETGCAVGDAQAAKLIPEAPNSDWKMGTPDLVITMLEQHSIPATGFVDYRYSILPYLFLHETWIESVEIRPSNRSVVHHCNLAYVTNEGASEETFITGYVPGGQPLDLRRFDNGVAYRIPRGAGLGLQIHYTTTGKVETCRIQIGLRFPRGVVNKQFRHFLLDPRGWKIPPHNPAFAIRASHTLEHNSTLLGLFTHMHVRGRDMTFYSVAPDATRETLLQIPNYNFEWQLGYEIKPGDKRLAAGTTVEAVAHFDNSAFNPYNPDPNKVVRYGPQTVDEMFNGFVFYVEDEEQLKLNVDPKTGRTVP